VTLQQRLWEWWGAPDHPAEWDGREGGGKGSQRFWEYLWVINHLPQGVRVLDVGSGETFFFPHLLRERDQRVVSIDPATNGAHHFSMTLEEFVTFCTAPWDCVTCISVLEHVDNPTAFCRALDRLEAPIILTCELSYEHDMVTMPALYACLNQFKNHHITKMESCPVWADNSYGGKWRPFGIYLERNQ
jgi:hypothetical protein